MNIPLLLEFIHNLKQRTGANRAAIDAIKDWLLQSNIRERARINPYRVATDSGFGVDAIVTEFLHGVTAGLFDLHWDIRCSHCNMVTAEFDNLADASGTSFCEMCSASFEADFSERVEVTFSLNQAIENVRVPQACNPPPTLQSKFKMEVPLNQTASVMDRLDAGRYRCYCPLNLSKGILVVEGEPTESLQEIHLKQLEGKNFDKKYLTARPGRIKIELTNVGHPIAGFNLHSDELADELTLEQLPPRLSGLQIIHLPVYQRVFGDRALSSRERMKIRSVTIMFSDITGSTSMYEKLGDTKAYNLVRDHFDIFFEALEKHGGFAIKTIGDAVMASFVTNEQAIKAAADALAGFREYNTNRPSDEHINVKIGIHRGSAVLVNLNNRLDYFGTTVNKAARIQGVSKSGEISFSQEVYNDKYFLAALGARGGSEIQKREVDLKGLEGRQVVYTVRMGMAG